MRLRPLTRAELRDLDTKAVADLGLPVLVLMENAGRGAAELLRAQHGATSARVLILCGSGNNGGDGGVMARHLDAWGVPVSVIWFAPADRLGDAAATQHRILDRAGINQLHWDNPDDPGRLDALLAGADWLVDGLFGTGLSRPVEGPARTVIEAVNRSGQPVLALDLPSGLDCDTGQVQGVAVRATLTASFVGPKRGFAAPEAKGYTGDVHVVEIGVPSCLLEPYRVKNS